MSLRCQHEAIASLKLHCSIADLGLEICAWQQQAVVMTVHNVMISDTHHFANPMGKQQEASCRCYLMCQPADIGNSALAAQQTVSEGPGCGLNALHQKSTMQRFLLSGTKKPVKGKKILKCAQKSVVQDAPWRPTSDCPF